MWTYLSGFAAVVYLAAPVLFLCFGIRPVDTYGVSFLTFFLPYVLANQVLFLVVGYGVKTWRGHQYSLALFPLWIKAVTTAVANVLFGRSLGFVVTAKTRGERVSQWRFVWPQLAAMAILVVAAVVGVIRYLLGLSELWGTVVNTAWVLYDLLALSVILQAVRFRGYQPPAKGSDD
jgi:cellulose synthase (UDP-forming)